MRTGGAGVAPSVQRKAMPRNAKRAENDDGWTHSTRILLFMAGTLQVGPA